MTFKRILQLLLAVGAMSATATASTIFNFDTDNLGTSTTFTDTVNGLSATFSSSADPGGFVVYQSMFETLTGNVLGDPGPAGQDGLALDIVFSSELSAIEFNFATADFNTPSPLTLTAFQNSQIIGSSTSTGMFLNGFAFPEGEIVFDGTAFNKLVISSTAPDFAVDNITVANSAVSTSSVPEPDPLALIGLGSGLLILGSLRRRSRMRALSNH
jgi:hypothetical protein